MILVGLKSGALNTLSAFIKTGLKIKKNIYVTFCLGSVHSTKASGVEQTPEANNSN